MQNWEEPSSNKLTTEEREMFKGFAANLPPYLALPGRIRVFDRQVDIECLLPKWGPTGEALFSRFLKRPVLTNTDVMHHLYLQYKEYYDEDLHAQRMNEAKKLPGKVGIKKVVVDTPEILILQKETDTLAAQLHEIDADYKRRIYEFQQQIQVLSNERRQCGIEMRKTLKGNRAHLKDLRAMVAGRSYDQ
jgi:hypothetical protein